ncbi:hypothetical protein [Salinispora pacifica]|uniref:hypothetical protein n=1 Tax=Salinispora pacifica TaxID=351187 RepID=UPI000373B0AD|nr:hypothetical protein [Salinispora pacifica]
MPTLRIPTLAGVSFRATGRSSIRSDRRGTVVSYTGRLILNGHEVLSPEQVRADWAARGETALREADRTEHIDPAGHAWAKGVCGAYATAVQLLDSWLEQFGPAAGLPLSDVVAAIKVARAAVFEQAPAEVDDLGRLSISAATGMLLTLAGILAVTASYEWEVTR